MKNCCNSTWLFDQGINSPFVLRKRGYLFNCASLSWALQSVLFPVMLHRVRRMSALSLIFQELNLVGISQGFHQHKVSADTSLPVGNCCDAAPWPGALQHFLETVFFSSLSRVISDQITATGAESSEHHTPLKHQKCKAVPTHSLG